MNGESVHKDHREEHKNHKADEKGRLEVLRKFVTFALFFVIFVDAFG
jgi:hypothetical protein